MSKRKAHPAVCDFSSVEVAIQHLADRVMAAEGQIQTMQAIQEKHERLLNELREMIIDIQVQLAKKQETQAKLEEEIEKLEHTFHKLEDLVQSIRKFAWLALGIVGTIQFLAPFLIEYLFK